MSPSTATPCPPIAGDTLASALLAAGVSGGRALGDCSVVPRGIYSAGLEEPTGLVQVDRPFPEPMLTATTIELTDGLAASSLLRPGPTGRHRRSRSIRRDARTTARWRWSAPDRPVSPRRWTRPAGPVARVLLIDERPDGRRFVADRGPRWLWATGIAEQMARPAERHGAEPHRRDRPLRRQLPDRGTTLRGELTAAAVRQRVWRIRATEVVLATGAHERPIVFAGNDRSRRDAGRSRCAPT